MEDDFHTSLARLRAALLQKTLLLTAATILLFWAVRTAVFSLFYEFTDFKLWTECQPLLYLIIGGLLIGVQLTTVKISQLPIVEPPTVGALLAEAMYELMIADSSLRLTSIGFGFAVVGLTLTFDVYLSCFFAIIVVMCFLKYYRVRMAQKLLTVFEKTLAPMLSDLLDIERKESYIENRG